jgi:ADP-ribose pyrophosphatase YjhB (NUDIX family)
MMTQWISEKKNLLPKYATHFVGIGGFVVNDNGEVLLIKEYRSEYDMSFWKIPGGMVDPHESIQDAAKREILEETGVETEFMGILGVKECMNYAFERSDLYFVALMKAKTSELRV